MDFEEKTKITDPNKPLTQQEIDQALSKVEQEQTFADEIRREQEKNLPKVMEQERSDFDRLQRAKERIRAEAQSGVPIPKGYDANPELTKLHPLEDVKARDIDLKDFQRYKARKDALEKMSGAAGKAVKTVGEAAKTVGKAAGKAIVPGLIGHSIYEAIKEGDMAKLASEAVGAAGLFAKTPLAQAVTLGATLPIDSAREMATQEQEDKELALQKQLALQKRVRKNDYQLPDNYSDEEFDEYIKHLNEKKRQPAGLP